MGKLKKYAANTAVTSVQRVQEIKFVTAKEGSANFKKMIQMAEDEGGVIVTNRNIPTAAVIPLSVVGMKKFIERVNQIFNGADVSNASTELQNVVDAYKDFQPILLQALTEKIED